MTNSEMITVIPNDCCFLQWALAAAMLLHVIPQCFMQVDEMLDALYNKIFRSGVLQHHLFSGTELTVVFASLGVLI